MMAPTRTHNTRSRLSSVLLALLSLFLLVAATHANVDSERLSEGHLEAAPKKSFDVWTFGENVLGQSKESSTFEKEGDLGGDGDDGVAKTVAEQLKESNDLVGLASISFVPFVTSLTSMRRVFHPRGAHRPRGGLDRASVIPVTRISDKQTCERDRCAR